MTDEPTMKLTDFDYLVGDHHLQMVKAALPYVNVAEQRLLSVFVKLRELQRTVSLFHEEQVAAMGICSVDEKQKSSPLEMMKAIKPYGNTQEQDFIDMVCNILQGPRMSGQYPDIVSAQSSSGDILDDPPPSIVPDDNHPQSPTAEYGSRVFGSSLHPRSAAGASSFGSSASDSLSPDNQEFSASPSDKTASDTAAVSQDAYHGTPLSAPSPAVHSMRSPLEQLKGFLPPDQQARLEQATFLIQALQQLT